jgi:hypothetical protein
MYVSVLENLTILSVLSNTSTNLSKFISKITHKLTETNSMLNYLLLGKLLKPMTEQQKYDQLDIDSAFMAAIEEKAAELEVTVDYYMAEFM